MANNFYSIKDIFSELVRLHSNPTYKNELGQNLIFKDYTWNIDDLEFLTKKGFDINSTDNFGRTPLFYCKDPYQFRLLLMRGANINHLDNNLRNILFTLNDKENVRLLLELDINKEIIDISGHTFLSHELFHTFPDLFIDHIDFAKDREIMISRIFENSEKSLRLLHMHDIRICLANRIHINFNPLHDKRKFEIIFNSLKSFDGIEIKPSLRFTFNSNDDKTFNLFTFQQLQKILSKG